MEDLISAKIFLTVPSDKQGSRKAVHDIEPIEHEFLPLLSSAAGMFFKIFHPLPPQEVKGFTPGELLLVSILKSLTKNKHSHTDTGVKSIYPLAHIVILSLNNISLESNCFICVIYWLNIKVGDSTSSCEK